MDGANPLVPFIDAFVGAIYNDDEVTGTAGPEIGDGNHVLSFGLGFGWGGESRVARYSDRPRR